MFRNYLPVGKIRRKSLLLQVVAVVITTVLLLIRMSHVSTTAKNEFSSGGSLPSNNIQQPGMRPFRNDLTAARWKVIVLSYLRGGSSLVGDIIQQHAGVFYVFEPLKTIGRQFEGLVSDRMIHYMDNTRIDASQLGEGQPALYIQTIRSIFRCRFEGLDNGTLQQNHMMQSRTTKDAYMCAGHNQNTTESQWHRLVACFQEVNARCRSAKVIAVKTIRFNMRQAEDLIASDPTVKVIHLIRDPRGVIASRIEFNERYRRQPTSVQAAKLCSQVVQDIEKSKEISSMFYERTLTVRYEDMVDSPVVVAKQLYDFLGIQVTPSIEKYIWDITYAGMGDGCPMCTVRSNASATANAWRNKLSFESVSDIQNHCSPLLNIMGYRLFQSRDETTNLNISAQYSSYDTDLIKVFTYTRKGAAVT